jgi:hypothetical protein
VLNFTYASANTFYYNDLKGNYLISYTKTIGIYNDNKRFDNNILSLLNNNNIYVRNFEDIILQNYTPIETFYYHGVTVNNLNNEIKYFYQLAKKDSNFGKYNIKPENILYIEGRYKGNPFLIEIPDYNNYYIDINVSKIQLKLREDTINRINKLYLSKNSKEYAPKSYSVINNIVFDIENYNDTLIINRPLKTGCSKIRVNDVININFNGIYKFINDNKTKYYNIYLKPNLPGLDLCEK